MDQLNLLFTSHYHYFIIKIILIKKTRFGLCFCRNDIPSNSAVAKPKKSHCSLNFSYAVDMSPNRQMFKHGSTFFTHLCLILGLMHCLNRLKMLHATIILVNGCATSHLYYTTFKRVQGIFFLLTHLHLPQTIQ